MLEFQDVKTDTVENVRVFVRIRPLKEGERTVINKEVVKSDKSTVTITKQGIVRTFKFSKIFDEKCNQIELYSNVAVPIVEQVLEGYNGTIFAYGQSGTGKTYTMIGDVGNPDHQGIIPNIFSHIFAQITLAKNDYSYAVTVTYLEIYNEEIRDLLSETPERKLTLRERPKLGVYITDLLGFTVNSLEAVTEILMKGNKNRATSSTKLNDISSRSHAIFTILVETKNNLTGKRTFGKINLVDLAGSERVNKTQATGDRLREAGKINLSLSVLGNVISALVDGKASHIPYRNSKLTRLLQDSLGGNSLTAMIALVSPRFQDCEESLYTLMYADRVKHIQNHVSINVETKSIIETFEAKIQSLKEELRLLELKEQKEQKRARRKSKTSLTQEEFDNIELEKSILENKINMIQKKILVGGENLVEKAQQQMDMLEDAAKELKHLDSSHVLLEEILFYKEKEKTIVKKEYANLKDEDRELDLKIEEAEKLIKKASEILTNKESEYQNEISTLLQDNKNLAKEISLVQFVVQNSIPMAFLEDLKNEVVFNEDTQEWQVKGVAYCGNNLRKVKSREYHKKSYPDSVYYQYSKKT
ncbi:unnamed protein product [Psylliodes chrysocephalus]|uniref:Kinesin-like protein n=1 Tax=Psylliodes chrysocephalus TaxID=3402493 RepID=A0A9P0CEU3_9CUCU|nr:unnamed protein product [Psylliodes chrysocephala]